MVVNILYREAIDSFCSVNAGRTKVCVNLCGPAAAKHARVKRGLWLNYFFRLSKIRIISEYRLPPSQYSQSPCGGIGTSKA